MGIVKCRGNGDRFREIIRLLNDEIHVRSRLFFIAPLFLGLCAVLFVGPAALDILLLVIPLINWAGLSLTLVVPFFALEFIANFRSYLKMYMFRLAYSSLNWSPADRTDLSDCIWFLFGLDLASNQLMPRHCNCGAIEVD